MATYRGVVGAVGLPGSGKSYYLVEKALEGLRRGIPVYSNAGFDVAGTERIESFRDFVSIKGPARIVFDELPLFFNARKWQSFPDGVLYKLTQIRKDRVELYYSAIHPAMVDKVLRMLTFEWVHCRKIAGRLVVRVHKAPEELGSIIYERRFMLLRRKVWEHYDTYAKVAVADSSLPDRVSDERFVLPEDSGGNPAQNGGGPHVVGAPPAPGTLSDGADRTAG